MRTLLPNLVNIELSDTFAYCPRGSPNVKNGLVRKPSLPFVFKIKHEVWREGVSEGQITHLTTEIRVPDARHHVNTFALGEIRYASFQSFPAHWFGGRKFCVPESFGDRQIGIHSSTSPDFLMTHHLKPRRLALLTFAFCALPFDLSICRSAHLPTALCLLPTAYFPPGGKRSFSVLIRIRL
jgi:hypothetical protein